MRLEEKLVQLRKRKGLSQLYVADALNVSRQAISRWEVGSALPATENLRKLAGLYGVPVDTLINDEVALPMEPDMLKAQTVGPAVESTESVNATKQKTVPMRFTLVVSVAVLLLGVVIGYLLGEYKVYEEENEEIPLSELETMDFDFSDAAKSTFGWPDFGEGGE